MCLPAAYTAGCVWHPCSSLSPANPSRPFAHPISLPAVHAFSYGMHDATTVPTVLCCCASNVERVKNGRSTYAWIHCVLAMYDRQSVDNRNIMILFCTCPSLCGGALWPMPAWVWCDVRSVVLFFSFLLDLGFNPGSGTKNYRVRLCAHLIGGTAACIACVLGASHTYGRSPHRRLSVGMT